MKPISVSSLRTIAVYSLISLLVWQPVQVYAEVAASALPVAGDSWVSRGEATMVTRPGEMRIETSDRVSLNWDSFNIGRDSSVEFVQPGTGSIALNRVNGGGNAATEIMGTLKANGVIYILDRNGILFGENSKVNVASLIASSLDINDELDNRFLDPNTSIADAIENGEASFVPFDGAAEGASIRLLGDGKKGAQIITSDGGQVFLFAHDIISEKGSKISTPDGQTILAASKDEVYLAASTDPDLRGMLVEVRSGGSIEHAGEIVAERGNITLAALAINQSGKLSATTSVDANGTIRLLARDGAQVRSFDSSTNSNNKNILGALWADGNLDQGMSGFDTRLPVASNTQGGGITFAHGSVTEVTPDYGSTKKAVDGDQQRPSFVEVMGNNITLEGGSTIASTGGQVSIVATADPVNPMNSSVQNSASTITIHQGALIDVSGADSAVVDMERNSIEVELRGPELADSPVQRNDAAIRGKTAYVDLRYGESIEFADISGYVSLLERGVDERLAKGGKVQLLSEGTVDFQNGATVDVSGGVVNYSSGFVKESRLYANGKYYDISEADPDRDYSAIINPGEYYNERWNIVREYKTPDGRDSKGTWVAGYREGKSAGEFAIVGRAYQFDGNVKSDVVVGPYQRREPGQLGGGSLVLDTTRFINSNQSVMLTSEQKFRENMAANGPQQPSASTTLLSVERLKDGADSVTIKSRGSVSLSEGSILRLDGGGDLLLEGRDVVIGSDIYNRSGDVTISARVPQSSVLHSVDLASGVTIDTRGYWINDRPGRGNIDADPVRIHGGDIELRAEGNVTVEENVSLRADAGAWRSVGGEITGGRGGNVTLAPGNFDVVQGGQRLSIGDNFSATSYSLIEGGTLSLTAGGFDLVGSSDKMTEGDRVSLSSDDIVGGGFSNIELNARRTGIDLAEDTVWELDASRFRMNNRSGISIASGTDPDVVFDVVKGQDLPAYKKGVVNLVLDSQQSTLAGVEASDGIRIGNGVSIDARPSANITLQSRGGAIDIDGSIVAKGGVISATVASRSGVSAFDPSLAIRLGNSSLLDVGATHVQQVSNPQIIDSELYAAGSVNLDAKTGYILGESGSQILADGSRTTLSQYDTAGRRQHAVPVDLAAGNISLRASEGIVANTRFSAKPYGDGRGGSLSVELDAIDRIPDNVDPSSLSGFTDYPLSIRVGQYEDLPVSALMATTNIRAAISEQGFDNGVAYLDIDRLNDGEFASVRIATSNVSGKRPTEIVFETSQELKASESIELVSPAIRIGENNAKISAPYVALGTTISDGYATNTAGLIDANGTFVAEADFIDVLGGITFRDASLVRLDSATDIRLRGALSTASTVQRNSAIGNLTAAGDVEIMAGQLYGASMTTFDIDLPTTGSTLTVTNSHNGDPRRSSPVMSANATLNFSADHIVQSGVIKAPFGQINLHAASDISLTQGSVTSTSAEGQTVLLGTVDGVGEWLYPISEAEPLVIDSPLDKSVSLKSPDIDHQEGALIDVSGGGDLLAHYFVKGPNGSRDVLSYASDGAAGESFAVVPNYQGRWAPYDALEMQNFPYKVGDTVRFEGAAGFDPGVEYAIMPARYALLPGALLITPVGTSYSPGSNRSDLRGAAVVAGQFSNAAGTTLGSRWNNFVVEPGLAALDRSELRLFSANSYFANQRPVDAGRVAYDASSTGISQLKIDGEILARAGADGVGGQLDINASKIAVGDSVDPLSDAVQLTADQLEQLEVDSILLGGVRSYSQNETRVDTGANQVQIYDNTSLSVTELMLAATELVAVGEEAAVRADRAGVTRNGSVSISGTGGAFIQVSAGQAVDISRAASSSPGQIVVEDGASLFGDGAVVLDSSGGMSLLGDINTTGTFAVNANRILLGADAYVADGVALDANTVNALQASELRLRARTSVDLADDVSLSLNRMLLDTPLLKTLDQGNASVAIDVSDVFVFRNSSGTSAGSAMPSQTGSSLILNANVVKMQGEGDSADTLSIQGFDNVRIAAREKVETSGKVHLQLAGNTVLQTENLTSENGSDLLIDAQGDIELSEVDNNGLTVTDLAEGFASRYTLKGRDVIVDTRIIAPSGVIDISASQDVLLGDRAVLDVAGNNFDFVGTNVATDGGAVRIYAAQGDVTGASGSVIDVSAGSGDAKAGKVVISAANGNISLGQSPVVNGSTQSSYASVSIDAASADNVVDLFSLFSGFGAQQHYRARNGDIFLALDDNVKAANIELIADNGSIYVDGTLDASGDSGGFIGLFAMDDVSIGESASIKANATDLVGSGGEIVMSARDGYVTFSSGSEIDLFGNDDASGGKLYIEATRSEADLRVIDHGVKIQGASSVEFSGYKRYEVADGQALNQDYVDMISKSEAADFMSAMESRLSTQGNRFTSLLNQLGAAFSITPGIEFFSDKNLIISEAIDLSNDISALSGSAPDFGGASKLDTGGWRYLLNDTVRAGNMRFRAGNDLILNADVSDGVIRSDLYGGLAYIQDTPISHQSWSFEFSSGSGTHNAKALSFDVEGRGDLELLNGAVIRTGTGDIKTSVGGDLSMSDGSAIYTAGFSPYIGWSQYSAITTPEYGVLDPQDELWALFGSTNIGVARIFYPIGGGDIEILVGGDIQAAGAPVPHTDWLMRIADTQDSIFTWGIVYENFVNGVGALGGGNIDIYANNSVDNLTVSSPTTAMQVTDHTPGMELSDFIEIRGGGDVHVIAGGDIRGGSYLVSRGELVLESVGRIGKFDSNDEGSLATLIALGEGQVTVNARNDIELSGVVDQNLLPISIKQTSSLGSSELLDDRSQFLTNTSADRLTVVSKAGDVIFAPEADLFVTGLAESAAGLSPYSAFPAQVIATALNGDIVIRGNIGIESHPESQLDLFASGDIAGNSNVGLTVGGYANYLSYRMTDALVASDYASLAFDDFISLLGVGKIRDEAERGLSLDNNDVLFSEAANPISIVARGGSIAPLEFGNSTFSIELPRAAYVFAGEDISDVKIYLQNNHSTDISYVRANGDITATTYRTEKGAVGVVGSENAPSIAIQGPGTLLVEAGGNIDLGASGGILSWGDNFNTALADVGANVLVLAGLAADPDFDSFAGRYMTESIPVDSAVSFIAATLTNMSFTVDDINRLLSDDRSSLETSVPKSEQPSHLSAVLSSSDTRHLSAAQKLFIDLTPDQQLLVASAMFAESNATAKRVIAYTTLQNEVIRAGYEDATKKDSDNLPAGRGFSRGFDAIETLFDESVNWKGDIALVSSAISTRDGGDITIMTPGGGVDVGLPEAVAGIRKTASDLGIIATRTGDVRIMADGDVLVNQSRIFALDGDVSIWSSKGDIDAGRGSKTARADGSARVFWDAPSHRFITDVGAVVSGSGIRATSADPDGAYARLYAPQGAIDAGDAGIGATNVIVAASIIRGADNFDIGGVSIGVPTNTGVSASVASAGSSVSGSSSGAMDEMASQAESAAESARQVAFLTVEIIGLGD